jgi:hypothetical protein
MRSAAALARQPAPSKIKVGITIAHAKDVPSVLWSNGIYQNIVYLALLFQKLSDVETYLVCYPFGDLPTHPIGKCFDIPTINTAEDALGLDVIIELGIRLELDFTPQFRDRGGKLVSYMAGNSMVMNFESVFLEGQAASRGSVIARDGFDAVWITPQHMRTNAGVTKMLGGPVEEAPHIWAPTAIEHAKASMGIDPQFKRPKQWSLATFDPNINVVKSFHYPLLVAEAAHRKAPGQNPPHDAVLHRASEGPPAFRELRRRNVAGKSEQGHGGIPARHRRNARKGSRLCNHPPVGERSQLSLLGCSFARLPFDPQFFADQARGILLP